MHFSVCKMIQFWLFRSPIGSPSDKPKHKYFSHVCPIIGLPDQSFWNQREHSKVKYFRRVWRFSYFFFEKNELSYSFGGLVEGYKNTRVTYLVHQRPLSFEFLWVAPDPDGIMTSELSWYDHLILINTTQM